MSSHVWVIRPCPQGHSADLGQCHQQYVRLHAQPSVSLPDEHKSEDVSWAKRQSRIGQLNQFHGFECVPKSGKTRRQLTQQ